MAALYFDKLLVLDSVGANGTTIGADHRVRDAVVQLKDTDILQTVIPVDVLA